MPKHDENCPEKATSHALGSSDSRGLGLSDLTNRIRGLRVIYGSTAKQGKVHEDALREEDVSSRHAAKIKPPATLLWRSEGRPFGEDAESVMTQFLQPPSGAVHRDPAHHSVGYTAHCACQALPGLSLLGDVGLMKAHSLIPAPVRRPAQGERRRRRDGTARHRHHREPGPQSERYARAWPPAALSCTMHRHFGLLGGRGYSTRVQTCSAQWCCATQLC